jgi:site-specific recombinase XerC
MTEARALQQGYLSYLAHERRLAAHTTANYRRDIDELLATASDPTLCRAVARAWA